MFLHKSYQLESMKFINYIELDYNELETILTWRNHPDVRKWMYNSEEISSSAHIKFCTELKQSSNKGYWLVQMGDELIGTININPYDSQNHEGEWGFYLNPQYFKSDAVLMLFYYSIELFFKEFKLNQLKGYVLRTNTSSLILNDFFGMLEYVEDIPQKGEYTSRKLTQLEWKLLDLHPDNLKTQFIKFVKNNRLKQ